ncbi:hypothetical protein DFH06DRAFT_1472798 [Mycena polygramma]|nr:hypothetical protein DFH06DRAFT_1472798 [Mycena polygramma]
MSQPPRKTGSAPAASSSSSASHRVVYRPVWQFDLRLFDFDFALPSNWGETTSHPVNLDVHSVVADQSPAYAESRRLPFLREDRWHGFNPNLVRSIRPAPLLPIWNTVTVQGVAQAPPAPRYNPELVRWLLGREPFSRHRLEPSRHHYAGAPQRPWRNLLREIPLTLPYADVAHEVCLAHLVMRWYVIQIVGPLYAPVRIFWARRPGGNNNIFRQFVPGNPANPPVRDLSHDVINEVDRLVASMEMYAKNPEAEAETLIVRLLFFERYLCWLTQVGASVRYSQYYLNLLDRVMRTFSPDSTEVQRRDELTRLRSELLMRDEAPYVIPNLNQPSTQIRTIEETWVDPRRDEHGMRSDQPYLFESRNMAELFDYIAHVGLNGPGERVTGGDEPPDFSLTSAVLEGDELDAFVIEQGEDPRNVFGATVPIPPPTPTPSPSPAPTRAETPLLSPPATSGGEMEVDEEFIPVPPASRPSFKIKIPSRKRPRARVDSEEEEEIPRPLPRRESKHSAARMMPQPPDRPISRDEPRSRRVPASPSLRRSRRRSSPPRRRYWFPPAGRPPEVRRSRSPPRKRVRRDSSAPRPTPARRSRDFNNRVLAEAPRLTHDTSTPPSLFEHEGHRPVGAVVRQLVPGCRRCGSGVFCTDDTDPNERIPNKPRRTCQRCFRAHETCESWGSFYAAYTAEDGEALSRFLFEYWEHLGNGMYQLLTPDGRLLDLLAIAREFPYRVFLYRFLPLQNTRRSFKRRGDAHRSPVPTRARSPASRSSSSSSRGRSLSADSGSPLSASSVLGNNPLDYDLDDEPAPPPSQQASSSRAPPSSASRVPPSRSSRSSTMAGSTPRPENAEAAESLSSLADLLRHAQEVSPEEAAARDAAQFSALLNSQPEADRERFLAYMRGVLDGVSQEGNAGGNASLSDRKGKGKAK